MYVCVYIYIYIYYVHTYIYIYILYIYIYMAKGGILKEGSLLDVSARLLRKFRGELRRPLLSSVK